MAAPIVGMAFSMASRFVMNEVLAPEKPQPQPEQAPGFTPFG